jgi:tetratricopeptide (TPR) repeat protein
MNETIVAPRRKTLASGEKGGLCSHGRRVDLVALLLVVLAITSVAAVFAQEEPSVADEMHAGIVAYKFSDYAGAAEHFKAALAMNPDMAAARLFLATAYAQQYIAGDESATNVAMAQQAIDQFKLVLNDDPSEQERYKSVVPIASLSFNLKRLDDAREYYGKAVTLKPDEARNYFMLGLIDWTEASKSRAKEKSELGLTESQMISKPEACASLRARNQQDVEDGMQRLQKALELQPDYDEAMGYMNLLFRERAEYECDDPEARKADLKTADDWTDKAIAASKAKTDKTAAEKPAPKPPEN